VVDFWFVVWLCWIEVVFDFMFGWFVVVVMFDEDDNYLGNYVVFVVVVV